MSVPFAAFTHGDVYIDYPFEEVMFRWDHATEKSFRKFYGQTEESEVPQGSDLYFQARLTGDQITAAQYQAGKPLEFHTE